MLNKKLIKFIALALITTYVGMTNTFQAFAYGNTTMNIQNNVEDSKDTHQSIDVDIDGESINVAIDKYGDGSFKVITTTDSGETHEVTFNEGDKYMVADGKEVQLIFSTEIDRTKVSPLTSNRNITTFSAYTPVYMVTNKVTFSEFCKTLSYAVSIVSGILTLGGTSVTKASIEAAVVKAAAYVGAANTISDWFDGYVKYDQYRTTDQFYTSYSGIYQYMYRTQNYKLGGSIGEKKFSEITINSSPGEWYFASRPRNVEVK